MELRAYQKAGVEFLRSTGRAILADEMGVGKTPQLIRAAEGKTLVVAPPTLHANWDRELSRWGHQGIEDVVVTSYHGLVDRTRKDGHGKVLGVPTPNYRGPWDTVIFDEAHHLKGRHTGYAKAGVKLANQTENAYLATGTPIRNWAHEIFQLCRALYPKDPRFSSFWRWADRWFTVEEQIRHLGRKTVTNKQVGDLREITTWETFAEENGITERFLRRELNDPEVDLELPGVQRILVPTVMGNHQANVYRSMEKDFFATWDGAPVVANSSGSQWANLMRLSSGVCFHPKWDTAPGMGSGKVEALAELIRGDDGPFLVFAWYRHTVDQLADWFRLQGYATEVVRGGLPSGRANRNLESFQEGHTDVLVGTYSTLSEGHNFTNCSKTILFESAMVPGHVDQAVSRTHRFGQNRACTVWTFTAVGTLDEFFVEQVLPAKRGHFNGLIEAADLRRYRGIQ